MKTVKQKSSVQLSLFPCQGTGVKDTQNGNHSIAKYPTVSEYLKTREGLFRLIASYPPTMPFTEAVRRARVNFTKGSALALPTCYQRDARKEVAL